MSVDLVTEVPKLPPRPLDGHKGTFGSVLILAGSVGMSGAASLCGMAALRGGAGLVRLLVPEAIAPIVAGYHPCYMVRGVSWSDPATILEHAKQAKVVVAGPGLGQSNEINTLIHALCSEFDGPLVLDADALNVLGPWPTTWRFRSAPTVITPHPGEFAKLSAGDPAAIKSARLERAVEFAQRSKGILILKGAGTVVTDGERAYVNTTGNPGMGTGGTGDVLAGLLGALLAQEMSGFDAAVAAVYRHGLAGDLARDKVGEVSLVATDVLEMLPAALMKN